MKNNIKVKDLAELYKILPKDVRKEYTIGIHGFDDGYWEKNTDGKYELNKRKIEESKENILENGLTFKEGRSLLSTARFSQLDSYINTEGYYTAGGVIIALPKMLKDENGNEVFIGGPDEENPKYPNWDRNHESTSVCDAVLPQGNNLSPIFIIGTYTKNENHIQVDLNDKHIVFNNNTVSNTFFEETKKRIEELKTKPEAKRAITETENQQRQYKNKSKSRMLSMKGVINSIIKTHISREEVEQAELSGKEHSKNMER